MSFALKDPLLLAGKSLLIFVQAICALLGGFAVLLVPIIALASQGFMGGLFEGEDIPTVVQFPLPGVALVGSFALMLIALFLFFGKLRGLIGTVGAGDPFTPANARRLNAMAWLALGAHVLAVTVAALREHLAALSFDTEPGPYFDFGRDDVGGILLVLVLFILARVFRHGAAMREDLEGTV